MITQNCCRSYSTVSVENFWSINCKLPSAFVVIRVSEWSKTRPAAQLLLPLICGFPPSSFPFPCLLTSSHLCYNIGLFGTRSTDFMNIYQVMFKCIIADCIDQDACCASNSRRELMHFWNIFSVACLEKLYDELVGLLECMKVYGKGKNYAAKRYVCSLNVACSKHTAHMENFRFVHCQREPRTSWKCVW